MDLASGHEGDRSLRVGRRQRAAAYALRRNRPGEHRGGLRNRRSRITDKQGKEVVTLKIKQHSRHRALKDLAKIFRMEFERQEISGPSGGPVEVTDHRARITERLNAIVKRTAPANDGASGST
jgi:hypothetical protein